MTQTAERLQRVYPPKLMIVILNPIMRWLLGTRVGSRLPELARLEFTGRKTGAKYEIVSALHDVDGREAVLTNSGWRWNFEGGREIEIVAAGERRKVVATLQSDPDEVARVYSQLIEKLGVDMAPRRLGIKSPTGEVPTHDQLVELAGREGLSVVYLDPVD